MNRSELARIARKHGTPVVVIDHEEIRRNYASFRRHLPRVQAYYAVKANPAPEIVRTLYRAGASFDVASLPEFMLVYENVRRLSARARQDFVWDKIVYANPIKPEETLRALDRYRPLVTYDNRAELAKIKAHAPHAGVALRLRVPNTGSMVELSSKFGCDPGEAVELVDEAFRIGLVVEGLSFHVGSQCTNFDNFVQALNMAAAVRNEALARGHDLKILDIGGGFPVAYDRHVKPISVLARTINPEIARLFPPDMEILAEPGRYLVATAATSVARVIGKAVRDGKPSYYIDDSVYHTYSGIIFDHCQYSVKAFRRGRTEISAVFGQTCDGLDTISRSESLPALEIGDLVYSENIGAYSNASSTWFNGFPPAKVVHVNQ
ncbi:MAG TPA: type III PLP-dependent enzyme [Vicinamibacteria bacterium]|nr:type III PLP-dependent enzyme [Vicinamibacteria bacterium]